jgi:hypothetical protein
MVKHPVILRGYQAAINDRNAPPVLVQRLDQEFIPGLLDGFRKKLSPSALGQATGENGVLIRLFQPIHRAFNFVLLEAVCDRPGSPRLNPRDIASAGFVVRRVENGAEEGWMLHNERVVGWADPPDPQLDPDPAFRKPRLNTGNVHLNGKLAAIYQALEPPAERVYRLFVAPPDVCAAAGRTLLYGLIPVTSSERSEDAPPPVAFDPDIVTQTMPGFLLGDPFQTWPDLLKTRVTPEDLNDKVANEPSASLTRLMQNLRLMHYGWHAFDPVDGVLIRPLLDTVTLDFEDGHTETLIGFLDQLAHRFLLRDDGHSNDPLVFPETWPQPDANTAARLLEVVGQSLEARLREGVPNVQRFDDAAAVYRIHSFLRVRCSDGCPPVLQWAPPSAPFQIVPWWEGGAPLHTISLPDFDRESIKKIKPNIAFKVPPRLAALLNQKPEDFLNGNATDPGSGLTLGWICSFSIPIITLCAFIVLNIFLGLLHIVFWWLFYIKICLPIPKPQSSSS